MSTWPDIDGCELDEGLMKAGQLAATLSQRVAI